MPVPTAEEKERSDLLRARVEAIMQSGETPLTLSRYAVGVLGRFDGVEMFGGPSAQSDPAAIAEQSLRGLLNGRAMLAKNLDRWQLVLDERDREVVSGSGQTDEDIVREQEPTPLDVPQDERPEIGVELEEPEDWHQEDGLSLDHDFEQAEMDRAAGEPLLATKSGKVLSEDEIQALSREAEEGYDVEQIEARKVADPATVHTALLANIARLSDDLERARLEVLERDERIVVLEADYEKLAGNLVGLREAFDTARLEAAKIIATRRADTLAQYVNMLTARLETISPDSETFDMVANRIERVLFFSGEDVGVGDDSLDEAARD